MRAGVREDLADFSGAQSDYQLAFAAFSSGTPEHRQAAFGLARLLLADQPAEAARIATGELANGLAQDNWEGHLINARAAAILGQTEAARQALQRAWAAAPAAPFAARAIPRIANDMALQAGLAGDRATLIALSAVSRAERGPIGFAMHEIRAGLPVCASHGLRPADRVIVELINNGPAGPARVRLVYASRAGIARPFLHGLIDNPAFATGHIRGPAAMLEMRCLTTVQPNYNVFSETPSAPGTWLLGKGAYPLMPEDPEDEIPALAHALDLRAARFGADSPQLLPILLQQHGLLQRYALALQTDGATIAPMSGMPVSPLYLLADTAERIDRILSQTDAPADIRLMARALVLSGRMWAKRAAAPATLDEVRDTLADSAAIIDGYQRLISDALADPAVTLDTIYALARLPQWPVDVRADLARHVLAAFERRTSADDPRRQALTLLVAADDARRGNRRAAAARRQQSGFAPDLCLFASPEITQARQNGAFAGFPNDLRRANIEGLTMFDFDVSAAGEVRNLRTILAEPPLLFDAVATPAVAGLRFEPPRIDGKPASCRGHIQSVRWELTN